MWGYRTRDVARMLGLPQSRVRSFVRAGFGRSRRGPRGELRFSFEDLVLLRAASGLYRARVPARRVRAALRRLRQQLPEGHGLAGVSIAADGERVVVRQGGSLWRPESGQTVFDFEVKDLAEKVAPLLRRPGANRALAADDWASGWLMIANVRRHATSAARADSAAESIVALTMCDSI